MSTPNKRMLDFLLKHLEYWEDPYGNMILHLDINCGRASNCPGDAHAAVCKMMANDKKSKSNPV